MSEEKNVTHLHFIRHGEVEVSAHRLFGGSRLDHGLSPRGAEQAEALARYTARVRYDAFYVSPMIRAQRTLAPIAARHPAVPITTLHDLRELDFGGWTGLRWEQVQEKFGVSAYDWLEQLESAGFPDGGETAPTVLQRVCGCLDQILAQEAGRTVGIVCHGGIVRVALSLLCGFPLRQTAHLEVDYASLTWVTAGEKTGWRPRHEIQLLNLTPWRDLEPPPPEEDLPA